RLDEPHEGGPARARTVRRRHRGSRAAGEPAAHPQPARASAQAPHRRPLTALAPRMRPLPPPDDAPQRVRVTSSRRAPAAPARRPLQTELDEQTTLGEVYVRGLMGAQF